jgi:hypothetical protein
MDQGLQAIDHISQALSALIADLQKLHPTLESTVYPNHNDPYSSLSASVQHLHSELSRLEDGMMPVAEVEESVCPSWKEEWLKERRHGKVAAYPMGDPLESLVAPELLGESSLPSMHHKDVLEDEDSIGFPEDLVTDVPVDMQVRRLMAQLTAAYNRIAALEEQLLFSHRPSQQSHKAEV